MKKSTAIRLLKTKAKLAAMLGITDQAVGQFPDPIPPLREFQVNLYIATGEKPKRKVREARAT